MMRILVRQHWHFFVGDIDDVVPSRRALRRTGDVAYEACDSLVGAGLGGEGKYLVVVLSMVGIAEYAAGMIDESQRFFDVPLTVARLGIIFSYQTAKRGPHLLIGGALGNCQGLVQRSFHGSNACKTYRYLTLEYSVKYPANAS